MSLRFKVKAGQRKKENLLLRKIEAMANLCLHRQQIRPHRGNVRKQLGT